jgi:nucleoside-diphosphate-sugar epimerase
MPIWVLAANLGPFEKAARIVAISSTSRFGKATSDDPKERALAEKLTHAEDTLEAWAALHNVPTTILRPTLIYDCQTDQNVTRIARLARKIRCFPVAFPAKGLRQPIHADDVANAALRALLTPESAGKALNISGGEILTYAEMVRRTFRAAGRPPLLIPLSVGLLESLYRFATKTGIVKSQGLGFGAFRRMNEDLVFDTEESLKLLSVAPRPFLPVFRDE